MGIDKKTVISTSIIIDYNKGMIDSLKDNNILNVGEDSHKKDPKLWFTDEIGTILPVEYYFDEDECKLHYSCEANTKNGKVYVSLDLPLSDTVLIDIIQHSVKRLNKLKTALETLR